MIPEWDSAFIVVPLILALVTLIVVFGIALFVEWYRGWPGWPTRNNPAMGYRKSR